MMMKRNSWAVPWYLVSHDMLHMISAVCAARDLDTIAPGPIERVCWRQFAVQWGDCKKSQIAPVSAIIIIIIIIIIIPIIIIIFRK